MFFSPSPRRHRRQLPISERRLLLMAGDMLAVLLSVLIGLRVWALVAAYAFTADFVSRQSYLFFVLALLWLLLASVNDFYDLNVAADRMKTAQRLLLITAQQIVIYVLIFFLSPREALPRLFILYYGVSSFVMIGLWRFVNPALIGWAAEPRRTLIIGADGATQTIIETIRNHAADNYEIKGIIGTADQVGNMICGIPVIGTGGDLMNYVMRDRISELVITTTRDLDADAYRSAMDAYEQGITVVPMTLLYENITGRVPVEHVEGDWALVLLSGQNDSPLQVLYTLSKRGLDILLGLLGLLVFMVLLPLLALAIRLDSPGNIFYWQDRVGLNGRVFRMYKFRSMVSNAEKQSGAVFSHRGDPRITRIGNIMRKTRLDELPQVINVLRGDMSVVGPRPERPEHVTRLSEKIPFYRTRQIVRPGLTGWAQVRYDYGANDEDALVKLQYDLYYIRHQSLLLDFGIMLRTVGKVLAFKGV